MKVIVVLNRRAGAKANGIDETVHIVRSEFAQRGVDATVQIAEVDNLGNVLSHAAAQPIDALVVGGGDGTINAAANICWKANIPLGVLPLGTLNHFAKDVGMPVDLAEAVAALAAGNIVAIDIATVNDRAFLNNSSIGVYPRAVRSRERKQRDWRLGKWMAMTLAMVEVFWRLPLVRVRLSGPNGDAVRLTPVVLVANNRYNLAPAEMGTRDRLDRGELAIYVANTQSRWQLCKLAALAATGRLETTNSVLEMVCLPTLTVESRRSRLRIALDGEVTALQSPLEYRILPQALRILAPLVSPTSRAADRAVEPVVEFTGSER